MTGIDPTIAGQLARFSRAFNSNDVAEAARCVTDDFVWIYYEGPDRPEGRVIRGVEAACAAVVERASASPERSSSLSHGNISVARACS